MLLLYYTNVVRSYFAESNEEKIHYLTNILQLNARFEISINTNISVFRFYGYIGNIREISVDILTKLSIRRKLFKIHGNI